MLPDEWKLHGITPIFKAGNKTLVKNYRPISLLSSVSKVMEKLVYNHLMNFLATSNHLFSEEPLVSPTAFAIIQQLCCLCSVGPDFPGFSQGF